MVINVAYYSYLFDRTVFLIFHNNYYNNNKELDCRTNLPEFLPPLKLIFDESLNSLSSSVKVLMCEMAFSSPLQCWQQSSCFS